jgi:hypothetical protein
VSDPNRPYETPPQAPPPPANWQSTPTAPGYTTQPTGWTQPAAYVPAVNRPIALTVAAILMTLFGLLVALVSLPVFLGGSLLSGQAIPGLPSGVTTQSISGAITIVGVVILVIGILCLYAGLGGFAGRQSARLLGIILGVIFLLFSILGLVSAFSAPSSVTANGTTVNTGSSIIVSVVFVVVWAFIVYAYIAAGRWFSARSVRV